MTLEECIEKYGLVRQYRDCFGCTYPPGQVHYHAEKENAKSKTIYHATNDISVDLYDGKQFYLTIERISKTRVNKNGLPYIASAKIIELQGV